MLAGGYGATDESIANLLMDAMVEDYEVERKWQSQIVG